MNILSRKTLLFSRTKERIVDTMSKSVYAIVTERIVKLIETAIETGEPLPWKKPWSFNAARNYVTAHSYRGVNALLLPPGEYVIRYFPSASQTAFCEPILLDITFLPEIL